MINCFTIYFTVISVFITLFLYFSTIWASAYYWPRYDGFLYFWVVSIPGFIILGILDLIVLVRLYNVKWGKTLFYFHMWLVFIAIWSGYVGGGLWLRSYVILETGTTIKDPLPVDNVFFSLNNATHDLPFNGDNPTFITFENWSQTVLRYDYLSSKSRSCATSGYKTKICVIPLVYQNWNETNDPVQVWVGCNGPCERTTDDYGKSIHTSDCKDLISNGKGCFSWWKKMNETRNETTLAYSEEHNYGYRHFEYIGSFSDASEDSDTVPLDSYFQKRTVLIRMSSPDDVNNLKNSYLRDGLLMVLIPFVVGLMLFLSSLFLKVRRQIQLERYFIRDTSSYEEEEEEGGRQHETHPLLSESLIEKLPEYEEIDVPPPTYEESYKYPHLQYH